MTDISRKLTTILAADVAGYSRLASTNEESTVARLRALRHELLDPAVDRNRGRVFKTAGDGFLIEFASVVDAARCAIDVQRANAIRNADFLPEKRIELRIGIHLGDVLVEPDGDLMGDGVNIAARLESIAEPGGICLSEDAWRQVRDKMTEAFTDLGTRELKNIARPVRVYAIGLDSPSRRNPGPIDMEASSGTEMDPDFHRGSEAGIGVANEDVPPRLSIVVLPFANIGGDPEQDYFVDGVTESLTTDLSRIPGSFVIARNTAFTFKGKPIDVKQIGRELKVRYALEGSVQRGGNRLRVNVQLIDAESGAHLWAERFDKPLADLFDMQDELVARLARTLDVELTAAEAKRAEQAVNPNAMDLVFRGQAFLNQGVNPANLAQARDLLQQALDLEPDNIAALTTLAVVLCFGIGNYMTDDRASDVALAEQLCNKALAIAPNAATAHHALGFIYSVTGRVHEGIAESEHALSLDRNLTHAYALIGRSKIAIGQPEEAEAYIAQAIRLSPRDAFLSTWCTVVGNAKLYQGGHEDEAVAWFRRGIEANRTYSLAYFYLAAVLAQQERIDEARRVAQSGLTYDPGFTLKRQFRSGPTGGNPLYRAQRAWIYHGMVKAGLPE